MSKVSNLINAYVADSNSASKSFGLNTPSLYWNTPRVPFEYYIDINLENTDVALAYYNEYFVSGEYDQIMPLVKTVDMPSMKIDTAGLNQYNRKRIIQNKVQFDPVKLVFHDVADGKTLAFWQMYYNYYFRDGLEPGKNSALYDSARRPPQNGVSGYNRPPTASPIDTDGIKHCNNDVLANHLVNHNFGYNLLNIDGSWPDQWNKTKNLIKTLVIYQVHGGRYNKVTLVNPRISAFTHDTLSYAVTDKTLELSFTFEYEYAYYNTENERLGADQLEVFAAEYMEIANPVFNVTAGPSFIRSAANRGGAGPNTGNMLQRALNSTVGQALIGTLGFDSVAGNRITTSTSSLSGILNIRPLPIKDILKPAPLIKSFKHTTVDNLKTLGASTAKGVLQSGVSSGTDFVVGSLRDGITGKPAYVPTDLAAPIKGATPGIR